MLMQTATHLKQNIGPRADPYYVLSTATAPDENACLNTNTLAAKGLCLSWLVWAWLVWVAWLDSAFPQSLPATPNQV
jgi:hypothetical protein